jgi:hypothetical protein
MQLTDRDEKIIQLLTESGWLTAAPLMSLFPTRQAFNIRIKKLIEGKILHSFLLKDQLKHINCPPDILRQLKTLNRQTRIYRLNHIFAKATGNGNRNLANLKMIAHQLMLQHVLDSLTKSYGIEATLQTIHDLKQPDAKLTLNETTTALEIERRFKRPLAKLYTKSKQMTYSEYINGLLLENDRILYVIQNKTDLKKFLKIPNLTTSVGFALVTNLTKVITIQKTLSMEAFLNGTR